MEEFLKTLTSNYWKYKSNGSWNDRILIFAADNNVYINDLKVAEWGSKGIALYFKTTIENIDEEHLVATYICDHRIDWVKINSSEEIYMIRESII